VLLEAEVDRRPLPFDVRAGAEARPIAGEHDRPRVADVRERVVQCRDQLGVERVAALGLRERHAKQRPVAFDPKHAPSVAVGSPDRMLTLVIRGAFAAALTPLRDGGGALDEAAFEPYVAFLAAGGVDGILACGTTGEG